MSTKMQFRLIVNSIVLGVLFGFWQHSTEAGCFMMSLCGFVLYCIDYFKQKESP